MSEIFTTTTRALGSWDPQKFDARAILHASEAASAAYLDPEAARDAFRSAGYHSVNFYDRGPTEVVLAASADVIVLAPRGTNGLLDALGDILSAIRRPWGELRAPKEVRVGWGFRRHARRALRAVITDVAKLRDAYPHARIVLVGHSLGAAIALLLAASLRSHFIPVWGVVALSSPRVGNAAWSTWYRAAIDEGPTPSWVIIHSLAGHVDIVPRLPPRACGARHTGRIAVIDSGDGQNAPKVRLDVEHWKDVTDAIPSFSEIPEWRILTRVRIAVTTAARAHFCAGIVAALRRVA